MAFRVHQRPNFLTKQQCRDVRQLNHNWKKSEIIRKDKKLIDESVRRSKSSFTDEHISYDVNKLIEYKLDMFMFVNHGVVANKRIQFAKYEVGDFFEKHTDVFDPKYEVKWGPPRLYTALIYLNDDFKEGHTYFNKIDEEIEPETGKLIYWRNFTPCMKEIVESEHESLPVAKGTKFVAVKLYDIKAFT